MYTDTSQLQTEEIDYKQDYGKGEHCKKIIILDDGEKMWLIFG